MEKIALVTGGSRGIGAECAKILKENGFEVIINYRNPDNAERLRKTGIEAIRCDVSDFDQVNEMFSQIESNFGPVDLLVNNAGIAFYGLFTDTAPKIWKNIFDVNVNGAYNCSYRALPKMISRHAGNIINISSMWGVTGASCEVAYSASKAAIIGFTKALAKEVGPSGIRVNCVAPGVIDTDMMKDFDENDRAVLKEETPLGRIGTVRDVAEAVAFLASEKAEFITGQVLNVNGGFVI